MVNALSIEDRFGAREIINHGSELVGSQGIVGMGCIDSSLAFPPLKLQDASPISPFEMSNLITLHTQHPLNTSIDYSHFPTPSPPSAPPTDRHRCCEPTDAPPYSNPPDPASR